MCNTSSSELRGIVRFGEGIMPRVGALTHSRNSDMSIHALRIIRRFWRKYVYHQHQRVDLDPEPNARMLTENES